jgi:hypothetical protein
MATPNDQSADGDHGNHFGTRLKAHLSRVDIQRTLRELQLGFSREIFSDGGTGFGERIKAGSLSGDRRLQIYRNNTYLNLTAALQTTYPVVQRLVGEGFFRYTAHHYISYHPARSGNLHDFGADFAEFLGHFDAVATLAFLPDVARLEWAYEQAYYAADQSPLSLDRLAQVPADRYETLKFTLHPAVGLVASAYPIQRIWEVNQLDFDGEQTVDLDSGGDRLLLRRNAVLEVDMERLAAGEFTLLQALAAGQPFATACELALVAQADLDVPAVFQRRLTQGTIADFFF